MVTLNDILKKIKCLESISNLEEEDRAILRQMKELLNKRNFFDEESFRKSYEQNIDYIQDVVDLFDEYYSLLIDTMDSKDKDCRPKGNNDSKSSVSSREKKLKLAKARAAALRLLSKTM